ncbi:serine/threonine protein kinase [Fluviicoccus keumensis]|uniref:non-specific serine/threonine protein kinase n=1 Tax=Fluviicoccus keumensis TaxID=1435465 RepID=A0A4Q7Z677_9GAMM|nr:serine/threonine-protein kinase [Fluviicoccus keumensis]RZU45243.1 serine/threonine protein kinase [Fluviicoccus keumensis]
MSIELPGYKIVRELGKGGMATVYLAVQVSFGREVALKVMAPHLAAETGFPERFNSEARMVAALSHPHIVTVYDVGSHNNYHYLAMEYHTGGDLSSRISSGGLTPYEALRITKQLADALGMAHSKGVVHRDIKPDNVLFRAHNDDAILTDFGIARDMQAESNLTQIGSTVGTPKYMSPEQARGLKVDGRADLYSLGIMLYEMLTGKPPFSASDSISLAIKHCQEPVPPLQGDLSRYQPLIDKLLAKDVKNRFQNGDDVMRAIDNVLKPAAQRPVAAAPAATPAQKPIDRAAAGLTLTLGVPSALESLAPPTEAEKKPYEPFFKVSEDMGGNFFFRKYTYHLAFSCDDYDEFKEKRERMHRKLKDWMESRGKKAAELHVSIQAHPWIHARIWEVLTDDQPYDSPFGMLLEQATVTLHVYDELEPAGKKMLLRNKGKKVPAEESVIT